MMNILFFSHEFYPSIGGIESISDMLAKDFQARTDVSVTIVTNTKEKGSNVFPFKVVRAPSLATIYTLLQWSDVVFENNPCLRLSWLNFLVRKPKVVGLQTWIAIPNQKVSLQQKFKIALLKDYNAVIACSQKIKDVIYNKAIVVPNPFNYTVFTKNEEDKTRDFIFLGRLVSDKGADMCIALIKALNKQFDKNFGLTIIGDGPEMETLKEMASTLDIVNQIRFLGFLTGQAIANELKDHRYLLVPSRWEEPFGIVALEGMACGCIPIVSNGGGLPDAVGNAGLVFERNSTDSLIKKTVDLLNDTSKQDFLLKQAESHLMKHRDDVIAQSYFEIIEKSINK